MDEQELAAPSEAAEEAVVSEESEASEATENTEGQVEGQPADAEQAAEKSKSQERRERREAAERRSREEAEAKAKRLADLERQRELIRRAAQGVEKPKESDFNDILDFEAAKSAYMAAQMAARMRENEVSAEIDDTKRMADAAEQQRRQAALKDFAEGIAEARARYPDFDQALAVAQNSDFLTNEVVEEVLKSDMPHDLIYHLGKNPVTAQNLSRMNPLDAARELGRIEARLALPKAKTQSSAPPPVTPNRGGGSVVRDSENMTFDEYVAARESGWKPS